MGERDKLRKLNSSADQRRGRMGNPETVVKSNIGQKKGKPKRTSEDANEFENTRCSCVHHDVIDWRGWMRKETPSDTPTSAHAAQSKACGAAPASCCGENCQLYRRARLRRARPSGYLTMVGRQFNRRHDQSGRRWGSGEWTAADIPRQHHYLHAYSAKLGRR
jgi:hypothetical protein